MPAGPVLVAGGSGFLGSHLVRGLLAEDVEVHVLTRSAGAPARLRGVESRLVRWTGDLTDVGSLERCCREARPRTIYHLAGDAAARRFDGDWDRAERAAEVNFRGTLNLVRAAASSGAPLRTFVRVGGLEEYGAGPTPYVEQQREMPRSPYSASQVAATHWCQMLQPRLDFALATLRPALVYGPAQSTDFLIPALIHALLARRRFPLTSGLQRRDLLHVDDLVSALRAAGERDGLRGAVVNVATGEGHAIRDVALWIARELDAVSLLDIGAVPDRPMEIADLVGCAGLAERLLGWRPAVTLADGLRRTVDWYRRDHGPGEAA